MDNGMLSNAHTYNISTQDPLACSAFSGAFNYLSWSSSVIGIFPILRSEVPTVSTELGSCDDRWFYV